MTEAKTWGQKCCTQTQPTGSSSFVMARRPAPSFARGASPTQSHAPHAVGAGAGTCLSSAERSPSASASAARCRRAWQRSARSPTASPPFRRGSARQLDHAQLVHQQWLRIAKEGLAVWVKRVISEQIFGTLHRQTCHAGTTVPVSPQDRIPHHL